MRHARTTRIRCQFASWGCCLLFLSRSLPLRLSRCGSLEAWVIRSSNSSRSSNGKGARQEPPESGRSLPRSSRSMVGIRWSHTSRFCRRCRRAVVRGLFSWLLAAAAIIARASNARRVVWWGLLYRLLVWPMREYVMFVVGIWCYVSLVCTKFDLCANGIQQHSS